MKKILSIVLLLILPFVYLQAQEKVYSKSLLDIYSETIPGIDLYVPVQDKFFGMKMGTVVSINEVITSVGEKGHYEGRKTVANNIHYNFSECYFAGNKWHTAVIITTTEGALFWFLAETPYLFFDEECRDSYNSLKEKLTQKYILAKEIEGNAGVVVSSYFLGSNGMTAVLSVVRENNLTYLRIEYINNSIYLKQAKSSFDEF